MPRDEEGNRLEVLEDLEMATARHHLRMCFLRIGKAIQYQRSIPPSVDPEIQEQDAKKMNDLMYFEVKAQSLLDSLLDWRDKYIDGTGAMTDDT